jgi:hypothetical protein
MHDLPCTIVLGSKDHRDPLGVRADIVTPTDLGLEPLDLYDVGELRGYVLGHGLEADGSAVSPRRCSTLHRRGNLLPSTRDTATGVSEAYVFSVGEQFLRRLGVPLHELAQRKAILLDQFVDIVHRDHPEITSIVGTCSSPKVTNMSSRISEA